MKWWIKKEREREKKDAHKMLIEAEMRDDFFLREIIKEKEQNKHAIYSYTAYMYVWEEMSRWQND